MVTTRIIRFLHITHWIYKNALIF